MHKKALISLRCPWWTDIHNLGAEPLGIGQGKHYGLDQIIRIEGLGSRQGVHFEPGLYKKKSGTPIPPADQVCQYMLYQYFMQYDLFDIDPA